MSTWSPTTFPSTQPMHAVDLTQNASRMPIHQRLTLPSSSTLKISAPPYIVIEAKYAFYPTTPALLTTINGTLDIDIPQLHPHAIPCNPTLTHFNMPDIDYQFQITALDYTKDHLCSRVTKATDPHDF